MIEAKDHADDQAFYRLGPIAWPRLCNSKYNITLVKNPNEWNRLN
jgi:hypothetical protein